MGGRIGARSFSLIFEFSTASPIPPFKSVYTKTGLLSARTELGTERGPEPSTERGPEPGPEQGPGLGFRYVFSWVKLFSFGASFFSSSFSGCILDFNEY